MLVEDATKLLDDFGKLPGRVERPRTFMEIAGYPHYENVCSNILAFFMDPEESHRLGTLVLDALVSTAGIDVSENPISSNVLIDREVATQAGNRIDLLITSDDHAILIENKIYANVNNPFADYTNHLDLNHGDLDRHKILLTVYQGEEGQDWNFMNLTYSMFVGEIRSLLGSYVSRADARYLTIFLDFLNTLENLQGGTRMDKEFVSFLADRGDDVRDLFANMKRVRVEMREKVQELETLIDSDQYPTVETEGLWRADTIAMHDNLYYMIRVAEDLLAGIDVRLRPHGWEIQIFARDKGDPLKLKKYLEELHIPFEEKGRFIHSEHFDYDESLDRIQPILQDVVDKLATYRGA